MNRRATAVLFTLALAIAGCTNRAAEILDTAQLEEQQQSIGHARELYAEIVRDYPDSAEAKVARERLVALATP